MADRLREETIELICKIYKKYPGGGALHIVLDDGNDEDRHIYWCIVNSISEVCEEDRPIFEQCAINLMKLGTERKRGNCICEAFRRMREEKNNA